MFLLAISESFLFCHNYFVLSQLQCSRKSYGGKANVLTTQHGLKRKQFTSFFYLVLCLTRLISLIDHFKRLFSQDAKNMFIRDMGVEQVMFCITMYATLCIFIYVFYKNKIIFYPLKELCILFSLSSEFTCISSKKKRTKTHTTVCYVSLPLLHVKC